MLDALSARNLPDTRERKDAWLLVFVHQFGELFPENENRQQLVDQIAIVPWGHLVAITISSQKEQNKALFYIQKTTENGWPRAMLENYLEANLYERQDKVKCFFF